MEDPESNNMNDFDESSSEDENNKLPEFANAANKRLNEIINRYRKEIKVIQKEINEDSKILKILKDHKESVESQVETRDKMLTEMKKSNEIQKHTLELIKRQRGKIKFQKEKLIEEETNLKNRFNVIQNNISKANSKLDKYKLDTKYILEELENWALAAKEKEDDSANLNKYYQYDKYKINDLLVKIDILTNEVNELKENLQLEITDSIAANISLHKTTKQLKILHKERQDLLDELIKINNNMKIVSEEIKDNCDLYYKNKIDIEKDKEKLKKNIKIYDNSIQLNKDAEIKVKLEEQNINKLRQKLFENENNLNELNNDLRIKKGELISLGKELSNKHNSTKVLKDDLEKKNKKYQKAFKEYENKKKEIEDNKINFYSEKEEKETIIKQNNLLQKALKQTKEDLEKEKNKLFEEGQNLFSLRDKESLLLKEIENGNNKKRILKSNIRKLENELIRQEDLYDGVNFKVNQLQKKIDWMKGKRPVEETNEISEKTEELENKISNLNNKLKDIENTIKLINEDIKNKDIEVRNNNNDKEKIINDIANLELENNKIEDDVNKIIKNKEELFFQQENLKGEIKKMYEKVKKEANDIFVNENKIIELKEDNLNKENEIKNHIEILNEEHKKVEDEKKDVLNKLNDKLNRGKELKLKYDEIINLRLKKNKNENSKNEFHSEAYYVIKQVQEKEELFKEKEDIENKIDQTKKEIKNLKSILSELGNKNYTLNNDFKQSKNNNKKEELIQIKEKENFEMTLQKKELDNLINTLKLNQEKIDNKNYEVEFFKQQINKYNQLMGKQVEEEKKKKEVFERSEKKYNKILKDSKVNLEYSEIGLEIEVNNEKLKNQFLKNTISYLSSDIPELKLFIEENNKLKEKRPSTSKNNKTIIRNHSRPQTSKK